MGDGRMGKMRMVGAALMFIFDFLFDLYARYHILDFFFSKSTGVSNLLHRLA